MRGNAAIRYVSGGAIKDAGILIKRSLFLGRVSVTRMAREDVVSTLALEQDVEL